MRRANFLLVLALSACAAPRAASNGAAADRLVVLVSVDGLAAFYLEDPKSDMPTIRRMAREGASARGMVSSFPTNTWPNHTTLVTGVHPGRHGVIGNSYFDRAVGKTVMLLPDPVFDKDEIVKVPTVYDAAHKAGLKTAATIWPASRNAKTLDWTMPDVKPLDLFLKYSTPSWMDELRKAGIPVDQQEVWCNKPGGGVQRDWMYSHATAHVIKTHRPNLVLLHLVELDHVEHQSGPRSPDAYWATSYADDRIRDLVDAVEAAGLKDRTTFFVVSDHGFFTYTRNILPNVAFRKSGLIQVEGDKVVGRQAWFLPQGGGGFVYVLDRNRRAELVPKLKGILQNLEGITHVLEEKDYRSLGLATTAQDPRMPDLVVSTREGYSFSDSPLGESTLAPADPKNPDAVKGTHGYHPGDPGMHATFVAWGAGIRRGVKLGVIPSVDVAPTVARVLGVEFPNTDGKALEQILER